MLALGATSASALEVGGRGEGAGEFEEPHGIAVDPATGDIYVADFENNRVDEFEANGTFVRAWGWGVDAGKPEAKLQECTTATGCQRGEPGAGAGEMHRPDGVAFDNVSGEPALYVEDSANRRVQKFSPAGAFLRMFGADVNGKTGGSVCTQAEEAECRAGREGTGNGEFENMGTENSIAVGGGGAVYVGDRKHVQWFSSEGVWEGGFEVAAEGIVESLALAPSGDVFLTVSRTEEYFTGGSTTGEVREYNTAGALLRSVSLEVEGEGTELQGSVSLACDGAGHLFVFEQFSHKEGVTNHSKQIVEFNETFGKLAVITAPVLGSSIQEPGGIALFEASKQASQFALAGRLTGLMAVVPAPPPGPEIESEEAVAEPAATSTMKANLNSENHVTKYHFEYGTEVGKEVASAEGSLPASFKTSPVTERIEHLAASTVYHYHLVTEDSEGHVVEGPDATVETLPALTIDGVFSNQVTAGSARLEAQINPLGTNTEYYFEYAAPGEGERRVQGGETGAAVGDVQVGVTVPGLAAHTAYTYRVIAWNALGESRAQAKLVTETTGGKLQLADSRQWQLVSPADKHGAIVLPPATAGQALQASAAGDGIVYAVSGPIEAEPEGLSLESTVLSLRGSDGWDSKDIDPRIATATGFPAGQGLPFRMFSEDLSRAIVQPLGEFTPLAPGATEQTVYLRTNYLGGDLNDVCPRECFQPLVDAANVQAGAKFGACPPGTPAYGGRCGPAFVDGTPDLSHVLLTSAVALTSTPTPGSGLYEWSAGRLQLVSVLPSGERNSQGGIAAVSPEVAGPRFARDAISGDGSRVLWLGSNGGVRHLYLSQTAGALGVEAVRLDLPQGGSGTGAAEPAFEIANRDASRVFFLDEERLTPQSSPSGTDLYEYDTSAPDGSRLIDLSADANATEAANVRDVLGVSEDGSYVYFAAGGALASGATPGGELSTTYGHPASNLYVRHDGVTTFIATLGAGDLEPLAYHIDRVSPDGEWLAFQSEQPLTGYDNHDVVSGRRDEEVYLYNALTKHLVCVSCDPTGARPTGEPAPSKGAVTGFNSGWATGEPVDGVLPPWVKVEVGAYRHQPRYLSDSGRLFFDSHSTLVPQDVNGNWDVYEYEPPGVGSCSNTATTYSAPSQGCVDLISSGGAAGESAFLDASETGGDVFFMTSGKLVAADTDTAFDVYDAHECTHAHPCAPEPAASPPPCADGESCKGPQSPQPSIYGAPASATFSGSGDLTPAKKHPTATPTTLTQAKMLARALRACRHDRARRRRAVCERAARRRYGAGASRRQKGAVSGRHRTGARGAR